MPVFSVRNVNVFDESTLKHRSTITFIGSPGSIISTETDPDTVIDGTGCTLLPGFIDSKVDADASASSLPLFTASGITTVIDCSRATAESHAMRSSVLRDISLPSYLATGSAIGAIGSNLPRDCPYRVVERITTLAEVERCVLDRVVGPGRTDYIKIILEQPGLGLDVFTAAVAAAHRHGMLVIGHAYHENTYRLAMEAGFDIVTPVPVDGPLNSDVVKGLAEKRIAVVPMLHFLREAVRVSHDQGHDFSHALATVRALHAAGVRICAGTSSNPHGRTAVQFGQSLYEELQLLVQAGLSNREALQAATYVSAAVFGLGDRGSVELGSRADLMLIEGNPLEDLEAVCRIRRVWVRGVEVLNISN